MHITRSNAQYLPTTMLIVVAMLVWLLTCGDVASGFDFHTDSAHGNNSYGINRSGTGYPTGDCAHCHDTLDPSICGVHELMLFALNDENFCFQCHKGDGSCQCPAFHNYNYSYRAGGASYITCPSNILQAFSFIDQEGHSVSNCGSTTGTSHNLTDIKDFITGQQWGYKADGNPCTACHNPHAAQGDPPNGSSAKSSSTRGYPVSRPSQHGNLATWGLWGDVDGEKMDDYTGYYQAPYRYNTSTAYEPDGSDATDGSNLTDYNTFCTDCHNSTNAIYSTTLGRNLKTIDWDNEKHGKGNADGAICTKPPYTGSPGSYVLSCLDCHEPHGSPNAALIREEVNGAELGTIATIASSGCLSNTDHNKELAHLCDRCHKGDWYTIHHENSGCNTDRPYNPQRCRSCHGMDGMGEGGGSKYKSSMEAINCNCCHYHGSRLDDCYFSPHVRRTF